VAQRANGGGECRYVCIGGEDAVCHGISKVLLQHGEQRPFLFGQDGAKLRIGQVEVEKGQVIGEGFWRVVRVRGGEDQGRDQAVQRIGHGRRGVHGEEMLGGVGGADEAEQQVTLGAEPLGDGGGGDARGVSDIGEGQPRGPDLADGGGDGAEDSGIGDGAGPAETGEHDYILNDHTESNQMRERTSRRADAGRGRVNR
jgi:hypothetical protein